MLFVINNLNLIKLIEWFKIGSFIAGPSCGSFQCQDEEVCCEKCENGRLVQDSCRTKLISCPKINCPPQGMRPFNYYSLDNWYSYSSYTLVFNSSIQQSNSGWIDITGPSTGPTNDIHSIFTSSKDSKAPSPSSETTAAQHDTNVTVNGKM